MVDNTIIKPMLYTFGDVIVDEDGIKSKVVGFIEEYKLTRYLCEYLEDGQIDTCYDPIIFKKGERWSQFTDTVDKYWKPVTKLNGGK